MAADLLMKSKPEELFILSPSVHHAGRRNLRRPRPFARLCHWAAHDHRRKMLVRL